MSSTTRYTLASLVSLFLLGVFVATPGAVLPQWRAEFGITGEVAWFFNLQLLGLVIGVAVATRVVKRHPLLTISAALFGLAYLAMAAAGEFAWIAAAAAPAGFAQGVLNVHANGMVGDLHADRRVEMLNRVNAAFGLGAVGAPLLFTWSNWRFGFTLIGLLFTVAALLAWGAPAARRVGQKVTPSRILAVMPLLFTVGLYVATEASISAWSGAYLTEIGYSVRLAGFLLSGYWLLLTLSRLLLANWVAADPLRRLLELTAGSLLVLAALFVPQLAPLFPLVAIFFGPIFGTSFALIQGRHGQELTGGMFYAAAIGSTVGPALFAPIRDPHLIPVGFLLMGLLLTASVAIALRTQTS